MNGLYRLGLDDLLKCVGDGGVEPPVECILFTELTRSRSKSAPREEAGISRCHSCLDYKSACRSSLRAVIKDHR